MKDAAKKEEEEKDENAPTSQLKLLCQELALIAGAVPGVDLRSLKKVRFQTIRFRREDGAVLQRVIEQCVDTADELRDACLNLLKTFKVPTAAGEDLFSKEDAKLFRNLNGAKPYDAKSFPEIGLFLACAALDCVHKPEFMANHKTQNAKDTLQLFVNQTVAKLSALNRRTLDVFSAKIFYYFARVYDDDAKIRNDLLAVYRTACLRQDSLTQATLINLILRNYLKYNLFELATQFDSKTTYPETASNGEYARYLYSMGRIRAVQLSYSEAHSKLMQAIRKAPQKGSKALG
jgi:hypothetical protein